jgi:hypothetical protein
MEGRKAKVEGRGGKEGREGRKKFFLEALRHTLNAFPI